MICRVSLMLFMLHYSSIVYAENETADDTSTIDFIEFLGDWETTDGEWVDPNELVMDDAEDAKPDPQQDTTGEKVE